MFILLIEKFRSDATSRLGDDGMLIACAEDAGEALSLLSRETYDLILLDMSADPPDGFTTLRRLRTGGCDIPVLALTGKRAGNRATALDLGADDAIAEPVDPADLRVRIAALVPRGHGLGQSRLHLGALSLCRVTREVRFGQVPIKVTAKEHAMLELMLLRRGRVLTKSAFLNHLYDGTDKPEISIIDLFVCKLRRKLERAGCIDPISTVWGQGYMLHGQALRLPLLHQDLVPETTGA